MKDVNGTSFQLLLGPDDWARALAGEDTQGVVWEAGAGSVTLEVEARRFPPRSGAVRLTPGDRRGADCDRFGNWYWISADRREIRAWRPGQSDTRYWSAEALDASACPPQPGAFTDSAPPVPRFAMLRLSGLAVTCRHHLLVGTLAPQGLLVFDLHASGPPVFTLWPEALDIAVFDIAHAAGGGAWVLDRGEPTVPARLWRLDDRLSLVRLDGIVETPPGRTPDFAPEGALPEPLAPLEIPAGLDLSLPGPDGLPGASAAVAVIGLPDDTALVLDAPAGNPARVLRFRRGGMIGAAALDAALLDGFEDPPTAFRGHAMAFLPDPGTPAGRVQGALLVVDDQGDQAVHLSLAADAAPPGVVPDPEIALMLVPDYIPLRRYGGRGLVAHADRVYYDLDNRWIPLAPHPRRRRRIEGTIGPVRFESDQPGTEWHRIVLDGCIPPGSSFLIELRAADDEAALERLPFQPLPAPYQRGDGPEIPFWQPFPDTDPASAIGSWETLVQSTRGRLVELRLQLAGDGRVSPRVRALRLHAPRFSYLDHYLPAVYREDAVSADFLARFLANVEGLFTVMENRVASAHGFFDTRIAPPEWLDWLAGWLGAELGRNWDDARRRLFLDHAELLFRWRGTPAGLKAMIDLATAPCPDPTLFEGLRTGTPPEPDTARRGVRLVEGFARRISGNPTVAPLPLLAGWTPADGATPIHLAFAEFALDRRDTDPERLAEAWGRSVAFAEPSEIQFSPLLPQNAAEAEDWRAFTAGPLGFPYAAVTNADAPIWADFLARRYSSPARLAKAHAPEGAPAGFNAEALPTTLPTGGARLADWIDFAAQVLPVAQSAHRFIVLAPVEPSEDPATRAARIDRIAAVTARECPAHTEWEVQPFWALFLVGSARLGIDTALGSGARFIAIELGRGALGEGFVGYGHPFAIRGRAIIGRDTVGEIRL